MSSSDIVALVSLAFPVVVSLAGALYQMLCQALPESRRQRLQALTQVAVHSVEQEFGGSQGSVKKEKALALAASLAKEFHVSVSADALAGVIEAAVGDLNVEQAYLPTQEAPQPIPASESGN